METTKLSETEKENRNSVHLYWNGAGEAQSAYGKLVENAMRTSPKLRALAGKMEPDGTQVTYLKMITEQFEEYGLADHCVAMDDKHLKLRLEN